MPIRQPRPHCQIDAGTRSCLEVHAVVETKIAFGKNPFSPQRPYSFSMTATTTAISNSDTAIQHARTATVLAHMEAECNHDVEATLKTFKRPRYEVMPFGGPTDGEDAVRTLLSALLQAFPDFRVETTKMYHATDCVIAETRMTGTQKGEWLGLAPTGKKIDIMAACFFDFEGTDLICERVYFDNATMMGQLTAK
jgi:predicted ester cyclase